MEAHVVLLPFPVQGHMKPMLNLANLLCHAGFHITFLNSDHNHRRLLSSTTTTTAADLGQNSDKFRFKSFPDGLPLDHPRAGDHVIDLLFPSTRSVMKPRIRQLLTELSQNKPAPTCIVVDGIMSFAIDIAEELRVPVLTFSTISASSTWTYFHLSNLIADGFLPVKESNMDQPVRSIPGLEDILRCRDLPIICRLGPEHPLVQFFVSEFAAMSRPQGLIINTFEELEAPFISRLGSIFPNVYSIGPLHALLDSRAPNSPPLISCGTSLWKEDTSCMKWLDSQPSKSVVYVSFGSLVVLSREQQVEFLYGLVNSRKPFLWVIRSNQEEGGSSHGWVPQELQRAVKECGLLVKWAPQEEVLAHPSIGMFLTHSGWNSTLESLTARVPMVCWPILADQPVNSRCVSELWGVGLDMKDVCDRFVVEKMVRDLMEEKREPIAGSVDRVGVMARQSVGEGGASSRNLEKLVEDIRSMTIESILKQ